MSKYDYAKLTSYVDGEMDPAERVAFDRSMDADVELRTEVELYKSIDHLGALATTLGKLNREYFKEAEKPKHKVVTMSRRTLYRRMASIAAVLLIMVASYFVIFRDRQSIQQLADEYMQTTLSEISSNSLSTVDSVQMGIQAFNSKNFTRAESIFVDVSRRAPENLEVMEYLGIIYLRRMEYDKAIKQFESLIKFELHNNPGYFLKAVALIKRNEPGDLKKARDLLKVVVEKRYQGYEEAKVWSERL